MRPGECAGRRDQAWEMAVPSAADGLLRETSPPTLESARLLCRHSMTLRPANVVGCSPRYVQAPLQVTSLRGALAVPTPPSQLHPGPPSRPGVTDPSCQHSQGRQQDVCKRAIAAAIAAGVVRSSLISCEPACGQATHEPLFPDIVLAGVCSGPCGQQSQQAAVKQAAGATAAGVSWRWATEQRRRQCSHASCRSCHAQPWRRCADIAGSTGRQSARQSAPALDLAVVSAAAAVAGWLRSRGMWQQRVLIQRHSDLEKEHKVTAQ